MRLSKKRKNKRYTIEQRIENALNKLPKWRRKYIYENEKQKQFVIERMVFSVMDAQDKGERVNIYKAFYQQTNAETRPKREGTLRDAFKAFKTQRNKLYEKYASYMYRAGYSAANYFYDIDNTQIFDNGYLTVIIVELPPGKGISYTSLSIEINWDGRKIENATMI